MNSIKIYIAIVLAFVAVTYSACTNDPVYPVELTMADSAYMSGDYLRSDHLLDAYRQSPNNEQDYVWDITVLDDKITLCLNGYYLDVDQNQENIIGSTYMKIWKFEKLEDYYVFIYPYKKGNNILSMDDDNIKVNKDYAGPFEAFQLIDVMENE